MTLDTRATGSAQTRPARRAKSATSSSAAGRGQPRAGDRLAGDADVVRPCAWWWGSRAASTCGLERGLVALPQITAAAAAHGSEIWSTPRHWTWSTRAASPAAARRSPGGLGERGAAGAGRRRRPAAGRPAPAGSRGTARPRRPSRGRCRRRRPRRPAVRSVTLISTPSGQSREHVDASYRARARRPGLGSRPRSSSGEVSARRARRRRVRICWRVEPRLALHVDVLDGQHRAEEDQPDRRRRPAPPAAPTR